MESVASSVEGMSRSLADVVGDCGRGVISTSIFKGKHICDFLWMGRHHLEYGLETETLLRLFRGDNFGKLLIELPE